MPGVALVRSATSKAWDCRAAWATGRRVSLTVDSPDLPRIEGFVTAVSATDAYVFVDGCHLSLDRVLAVHHPSLLGDSEWEPGGRGWRGRRRLREQVPGQTEFPFR